jgi:hypothetical protein
VYSTKWKNTATQATLQVISQNWANNLTIGPNSCPASLPSTCNLSCQKKFLRPLLSSNTNTQNPGPAPAWRTDADRDMHMHMHRESSRPRSAPYVTAASTYSYKRLGGCPFPPPCLRRRPTAASHLLTAGCRPQQPSRAPAMVPPSRLDASPPLSSSPRKEEEEMGRTMISIGAEGYSANAKWIDWCSMYK